MTKKEDEQPEVQPTEVKPNKKSRRSYPIFYKRRILTLVDQCTKPGDVGRLLRREGLYSSHLTDWRRQQIEGLLDRAESPSRGPKPQALDPKDQRIAQLEMDNALLERKVHSQTLRAQKAEAQVEFQKKIACLLGSDITELRDDEC